MNLNDENNYCNSIETGICSTQIKDYISVDEMAKLLSIARVTAYQLTKIPGFPCFYIGKRIIIPLPSFNRWAEEQAESKAAFFGR